MHSEKQNGSSDNQGNPFADRVDDHTYHSEAIREKRLNLILHLASYSAVLLIQGEKGSGKSTFLSRLREKAQPNWVVCRINGGPGFDKPMLYHALFRVFTSGIPLEDEDHPDESLALLIRELAALRHEHRIPVLIIDDADHLPDSALETIEELLVMDGGNEDLLSIVLSSEPGFEARLVEASLQTFKNRISHVFDLPAFSEQDTSEYIHLRLSAAGIEEGNPFTPSAMHLIHTSSRGVPGRINALAQQILAKEKKPQPRRDAPKTVTPAPVKVEAKPVKVTAKKTGNRNRIAIGLVLIPLIGLLFFQDNINRWLEQKPAPKSEPVHLPAPTEPVETAVAPPAPQPQPEPTTVERKTPPAPPKPEVVAPIVKPAPVPEPVMDIATKESPATKPDQPTTTAAPAVATAPPVKTAPVKAAPVEKPKQAEVAATRPARPESALETPPAIVSAPSVEKKEPAARSAPPISGGANEWLMSRPAGHYTLQLLAMSPKGAKRFIDRHALGDELHTFERTRNGKTLVVLIYGDYPSRADALAASDRLAARIKGLKPWIRKLASVQAERHT